jgi:hypothetical protein
MQTTARENFQLKAETSSGSPPYFAVEHWSNLRTSPPKRLLVRNPFRSTFQM